MPEMPEFIREAISKQGRYDPDEIAERADELEEDTLLGVAYPEEPEEDKQERLEIGPVEPADHA